MKRVAVLLFCGAALAGCRSTPSPSPAVPVLGSGSAKARLVGKWEGEYHSAETGRSGTIVFEFKGDVGRGDVLMMPKGTSEPLRPAHTESASRDSQTKPDSATIDETLRNMQVLSIRFIETSEGPWPVCSTPTSIRTVPARSRPLSTACSAATASRGPSRPNPSPGDPRQPASGA